jgi:hypothetical protein
LLLSLLEQNVALHLNKFEFPTAKDDLCQVWLKYTKWFGRSRKYKNLTDRLTDDQKSSRGLLTKKLKSSNLKAVFAWKLSDYSKSVMHINEKRENLLTMGHK